MASFINTNIPSLNAQRNLSASANSLNTSLQRLSSGLRINSAKDDAAGLGIAERMTSQIRGMNQAIRNSNDGISLAQTAEGALATTGDMLQRIRELAVQASNATNSPSDRQALQAEVGQLTAEINRMAQTTSFNGQMLLDGTMGTAHFQVGPNAGETIAANGTNFLTNTYGNNRVENNPVAPAAGTYVPAAPPVPASGIPTNVVAAQDISVAGYLGAGTYTTVATDSARTISEAVNRMTPTTGVTASAKTTTNLDMTADSYSFMIQSDNPDPIVISFSVSGSAATATDFAAGINAINAQSAKTGVTAEFDQANGGIKLTNMSGNDISIINNTTTSFDVVTYELDNITQAGSETLAAVNAAATANGRVTFDSQNSFSVTDAGSGLDLGAPGAATPQGSTLKPVSTIDVTTFDNAQLALSIVDAALMIVTGQRAQYGALQSRFEATINNLQIAAENTTNSRSRIQDADFAAETANLSRATILQQAGTTMLAQANQVPQNVLNLLR